MEKSLHTFDKKFLKSNIRDVLSGWDLIEFRVCNKGDDIYKLAGQDLFELAVPFLEKYGLLKKNQVRKYYRLHVDKAYPIYDLMYETNLNVVKKYLNSFNNLFYIGGDPHDL